MENENIDRRWLPFLLGTIVVLLLLGGFYLLNRSSGPARSIASKPLPFGLDERTYADHVRFENLDMRRLANMFKQEVTYVDGVISNDGARSIRALDVRIDFRDSTDKVVWSETRRLISHRSQPLGGGESRDFELAFESIPRQWNERFPAIEITGLELE